MLALLFETPADHGAKLVPKTPMMMTLGTFIAVSTLLYLSIARAFCVETSQRRDITTTALHLGFDLFNTKGNGLGYHPPDSNAIDSALDPADSSLSGLVPRITSINSELPLLFSGHLSQFAHGTYSFI